MKIRLSAAAATARRVCGTMVDAPTRITGAIKVRTIEPAPVRIGLKRVAQAEHGFGRTQGQQASGSGIAAPAARRAALVG